MGYNSQLHTIMGYNSQLHTTMVLNQQGYVTGICVMAEMGPWILT